MPQTLKALVETYNVTLPTMANGGDDYLWRSLMDVLGELPEHNQRFLAKRVTVPASGLTLSGKIVLEAYDTTYRRKAVPVDATVADLIHEHAPDVAYVTGLVRYVEANTLYLQRIGESVTCAGKALAIDPGATLPQTQVTTGTAWPHMLLQLVCLKTAIRLAEDQLRDLRDALPANLSNVTVPTAPSAPTLTYTAASASTVATSTLGSLGTAPSYSAPATTLTQANITPPSLDLSGATVPTAPSASAGVANLPSLTAFSDLGPLSLTWTNYDEFYNEEDPEIMRTEIQRKAQEIDEYAQSWQNEVAVWRAAFDEWEKSVDVLIAEGQMTDSFELQQYATEVQAYRAEIDSLLREHEQLLARVVQIYRSESDSDVAIYRAQVENAVAEVQAEIATYQGTVRGAIEQLQADLAKARDDARLATDVDVANKAKTLEAAIQQEIITLQRYQAQIAAYSAEVAGQRSVFDSILEKFKINTATLRANINDMREEYGQRFFAYTMNAAHGTHTQRHHVYSQV